MVRYESSVQFILRTFLFRLFTKSLCDPSYVVDRFNLTTLYIILKYNLKFLNIISFLKHNKHQNNEKSNDSFYSLFFLWLK